MSWSEARQNLTRKAKHLLHPVCSKIRGLMLAALKGGLKA